MTQQNDLLHILLSKSLWKRALQGASLALLLILTFLTIVGEITDGTWVLLPMLTVTIGGAGGGALYYLVSLLPVHSFWKKVLVNIVCLMVYFAILWFSFIWALSIVGLWN
jgi:hypothetical protein